MFQKYCFHPFQWNMIEWLYKIFNGGGKHNYLFVNKFGYCLDFLHILRLGTKIVKSPRKKLRSSHHIYVSVCLITIVLVIPYSPTVPISPSNYNFVFMTKGSVLFWVWHLVGRKLINLPSWTLYWTLLDNISARENKPPKKSHPNATMSHSKSALIFFTKE